MVSAHQRSPDQDHVVPFLILLLFIVVPLAEIAILVKVGQYIGWLWTILIVIFTAFIGTWLLRQQGFGVMSRAMEALASGRMPVEPVIEGMFLLIAGAFLLTPGLLTDAVGFLLLIPSIRMAVAKWTLRKLLQSGSVHVSVFGEQPTADPETEGVGPREAHKYDGGPIIDGEFERVDERSIRGKRRTKGADQGRS